MKKQTMDTYEKLEWQAAGYDFARDINEMPTDDDMDGFSPEERRHFLAGARDGLKTNQEIEHGW